MPCIGLYLASLPYRHSLNLLSLFHACTDFTTYVKSEKRRGKAHGKRGRVREGEGGDPWKRRKAWEGKGGLAQELRRGKSFEVEFRRAWEGGLVTKLPVILILTSIGL